MILGENAYILRENAEILVEMFHPQSFPHFFSFPPSGISFEEWDKFLHKNGVSRHFSEEQIVRFFIKITRQKFDPDLPNKQMKSISPAIMEHLTRQSKRSSRQSTEDGGGGSKKTSIFFKRNIAKEAPSGHLDMATFLFFFSSPIDSDAMSAVSPFSEKCGPPDYPPTSTSAASAPTGGLSVRSNVTESLRSNDSFFDKLKRPSQLPSIPNNSDIEAIDQFIDPSLLGTGHAMNSGTGHGASSLGTGLNVKPSSKSNHSAKGTNHHRHSMATIAKSPHKKLKKSSMIRHQTKRGSISTLRSYHNLQRFSKVNPIQTSDDMDIQADFKTSKLDKSHTVPRGNEALLSLGIVDRTANGLGAHGLNTNNGLKGLDKLERLTPSKTVDSLNSKPSNSVSPPNALRGVTIDDSVFEKQMQNTQQMEELVESMKKRCV